MPHLYIFAVCEKAIIDETGTASLIGLFTTISGTIPEEVGNVPPNAVAAKEWCVFSAWKWEPEDAGKEFTQRGDIRYPNGTVFMQIPEMKFRMEPDKMHQYRGKVLGFPIGQLGVYTVQMWLDHDNSTILGPLSITVDVQHQRQRKSEVPA